MYHLSYREIDAICCARVWAVAPPRELVGTRDGYVTQTSRSYKVHNRLLSSFLSPTEEPVVHSEL